MKQKFYLTLIGLFLAFNAVGQVITTDTLQSQVNSIRSEISSWKRLKISGYIQPQFQYADSSGQPAIGGNFAAGTDKRFMVRRGRVKFQYTSAANKKGIQTSQFVLQFDVTERGLTIKDAYAKAYDPWTGWFSVTAGMFNRPFGHEVGYSSSMRESPERARVITLMFPGERDLGGMLTIQGPRGSKWNAWKIEAGLFNGNGAPGAGGDVSDFDKKKDFIGRLSYENIFNGDRVRFGAGVSYYNGGYRIDSVNVFKSGNDVNGIRGFELESPATVNGAVPLVKRDYTERTYAGVDAQVTLNWYGGNTTVRGEFITGEQPASSTDTRSPNDRNPISRDIYYRDFNGAIFYFIHTIGNTPVTVIAKYDWYDPNTDVEKNEVGRTVAGSLVSTNSTDLRYETLGFGAAFQLDDHLKFTGYYDIVTNEFSNNVSGYTKDKKDNLFTLRMQFKF